MNLSKYAIAIIGLLLFTIACKEEVKEKKEVLRPVKFEVAGNTSAAKQRSFTGNIKAGDEIELSFRANGVITVNNASVGKKVKKGDVIAKLDNLQANLAYEQANSALTSARSAMNTAKSSLDRTKSLYEKGSKSLADYENAKNQYQSALDQFESAKRNRGIQSSQISYGIIKAPADGIIASTGPKLNENVSAGTVIAVLNAGSEVNVQIGVPENVVNEIKNNMEVAIEINSIDGKTFKGTVYEVSPILDATSATYPVKIHITDKDEAIKPGMSANVTFDFGDETETNNKLIVPVKAVGEDTNGNFVFIIESEDGKTGTVKKQTIEIGELTTAGFEVKSGLNEGQRYATAGLQTLLDGQKVRLQ